MDTSSCIPWMNNMPPPTLTQSRTLLSANYVSISSTLPKNVKPNTSFINTLGDFNANDLVYLKGIKTKNTPYSIFQGNIESYLIQVLSTGYTKSIKSLPYLSNFFCEGLEVAINQEYLDSILHNFGEELITSSIHSFNTPYIIEAILSYDLSLESIPIKGKNIYAKIYTDTMLYGKVEYKNLVPIDWLVVKEVSGTKVKRFLSKEVSNPSLVGNRLVRIMQSDAEDVARYEYLTKFRSENISNLVHLLNKLHILRPSEYSEYLKAIFNLLVFKPIKGQYPFSELNTLKTSMEVNANDNSTSMISLRLSRQQVKEISRLGDSYNYRRSKAIQRIQERKITTPFLFFAYNHLLRESEVDANFVAFREEVLPHMLSIIYSINQPGFNHRYLSDWYADIHRYMYKLLTLCSSHNYSQGLLSTTTHEQPQWEIDFNEQMDISISQQAYLKPDSIKLAHLSNLWEFERKFIRSGKLVPLAYSYKDDPMYLMSTLYSRSSRYIWITNNNTLYFTGIIRIFISSMRANMPYLFSID